MQGGQHGISENERKRNEGDGGNKRGSKGELKIGKRRRGEEVEREKTKGKAKERMKGKECKKQKSGLNWKKPRMA